MLFPRSLSGHFKTGQWKESGTMMFYPLPWGSDKPVFVRQLRGAALEDVAVMEQAVEHRGHGGTVDE